MPEGRVVHHHIYYSGPDKTVTKVVGSVIHVYHYHHVAAAPPDNNVTNNANSPSAGGSGPSTIPDNNVGGAASPSATLAEQKREQERRERKREQEMRRRFNANAAKERVRLAREAAARRLAQAKERARLNGLTRVEGQRLRLETKAHRRARELHDAIDREVRKRLLGEGDWMDQASRAGARQGVLGELAELRRQRRQEAVAGLIDQRSEPGRVTGIAVIDRLAANPGGLKHLRASDLRATFGLQDGGLDPENPTHVRLVQEWLRAHGHGDVDVDGVWGRKTFDGLVDEMHKLERQEWRADVRAVTEAFFDTGAAQLGVPGMKGKVTPENLLRLLERGGPVARRTAALLWNRVRADQLNRLQRNAFQISKLAHEEYRITKADIDATAERLTDHDAPWYLDAVEWIGRPGDWTRRQLVETYEKARDDIQDIGDPSTWFFRSDERSADASLRAKIALTAFEREHPWWNLAFELVVDPINLIPGRALLAPFQATGRAALLLERVGFRLAADGRLGSLPLVLAAPAGSSRFLRDSVFLPVLRTGERALTDPFFIHPALPAVYRQATHAFQAADITVGLARNRVADALRRGFGVGESAGTAGRVTAGDQLRVTRGLRARIEEKVGRGMRSALEGSDRQLLADADQLAPGVFQDIVDLKLSLYANATDAPLSQVGRPLKAFYLERFRTDEIKQLAAEEEQAAYAAARDRGLAHDEAASEAAAAYVETIQRGGTYLTGAADPVIGAILRPRMQELNWRLDNVIFPALQRRLQAIVPDLWDEGGEWVGRNGDVVGALRQLGVEAFDPRNTVRVRNPIAGQTFTRAQKDDLIDDELHRVETRSAGYADTQAAAGRRPPEGFDEWDAWVDAQVATKRAELARAWRLTAKGWEDTREFLEVPAMYAGHYASLYDARYAKAWADRAVRQENPYLAGQPIPEEVAAMFVPAGPGQPRPLPGSKPLMKPITGSRRRAFKELRAIAELPADREPSRMTEEASRLGALLRGSGNLLDERGRKDLIRQAARVGARVQHGVERREEGAAAIIAERNGTDPVQRLRDALETRTAVLKEAERRAMGVALAQEGAYWRALKYSTSRPARVIYWSAQGWMSTWRFLALPARPGWGFINSLDNFTKGLLDGVVNPQSWFLGAKNARATVRGEAVRSIFELGVAPLRGAARMADGITGSRYLETLDQALDHAFWRMPSDRISSIFADHGVPIDERVLEFARYAKEGGDEAGARLPFALDKGGGGRQLEWITKKWLGFHDGVWEMVGNKPENFARRVIFRDKYSKALANGADPIEATRLAWAEVEKTLFDYSKISTVEDNLRFFIPFVQFWRKNTVFWAKTSAEKPWFLPDVIEAEQGIRDIHEDWPEWMRRYISAKEVSDAFARVPGLHWLAPYVADLGVQDDPLNYFSFGRLYRAFKGENPMLPGEDAGMPFISGFVDALDGWGAGLNPLLRKPLEHWGILTSRAWQNVFPQTGLIEAFTRKYFNDRFPNGLNLEAWASDHVYSLIGEERSLDDAASRFDEYVRLEMAAQAQRGETPDRKKAEEKLRDYFLVQSLFGYFAGLYVNRMTPSDFYNAQIADQLRLQELDWTDLTPEQQAAYRLYSRRTDSVAFQRYLDLLPMIRAYYKAPTYLAGEQLKRQHPEIIPFVNRSLDPFRKGGGSGLGQQRLVAETGLAFQLFALVDELGGVDRDTWDLADKMLVPNDLREFWRLNDTPVDVRRRQLRAEYFRHLNRLNETFHALPEDDFDARKGFLDEHPELARWWGANDEASDSIHAVINETNADLRDVYFSLIESDGWDTASAFLHAHPFIFEFTKAADRVSDDGDWISDDGRVGHGFGRGLTQHARDYLAAKRWLDYYFGLSKAQRQAWLKGGSTGAAAVLGYFKKYGRHFRFSRGAAFGGSDWTAWVAKTSPEVRRRAEFWARYWSLTPDKRVAYVRAHAVEAGIFVWGPLGADERYKLESEWMRRAIAHGLTEKAARYLRIKPLLDVYFTLDKHERSIYIKAVPEIQAYFDDFSKPPTTGDAELDRLVEAYFKLPFDSDQRTAFLRKHPRVQRWFDSRGTPAERAMHRLLETYFRLDAKGRREFIFKHPEVSLYFDKQQAAKHAEAAQLRVFEEVDPRLDPFRPQGELTAAEGERMAYLLALKAIQKVTPQSITVRRPGQ